MLFNIGEVYSRRNDIHAVYGGSYQSGIAPSAEQPLIFLFSGQSGEQYGYEDDWSEGVFLYTGEGQVGDMEFSRGNRAIRDHAKDGRDLHLFRSLGKSKPHRYEGQFSCTGWHNDTGPDRNGNPRETIVFHLVSVDDLANSAPRPNASSKSGQSRASLEVLRQRAFLAAGPAARQKPGEGRQNIYQRSEAVREYVLARANGKCECCGSAAPFKREDGSAYLEPHHIRRLSDGGPDHPRWVAATCPNCHREIHFGAGGNELNDKLANAIGKREIDAE